MCVWVDGESWGLPGCCRGDQRPQVTSDLRTLGALQEESFEFGGYGCVVTQVKEHVPQWRDNGCVSCCWTLRW